MSEVEKLDISRKEIGAAAKDFWVNRLEMAEPKYCANGSWDHFLDGFTFGAEWALKKKEKHTDSTRRTDYENVTLCNFKEFQ